MSNVSEKKSGESEPIVEDIWMSIALENIMYDVGQALDIDERKIKRIKGIIFGVDEHAVKRYEYRIMDVLDKYLDAPYGSLMSYYKSMGMKDFMQPLIDRLKRDLLMCARRFFEGRECEFGRIIEEAKQNIKQIFLKRKKPFMRVDFHNRRLNDILNKMSAEIGKIISDYERLKPPEKKILEKLLRISEMIRDPISYYNIVWAIGFIFKVLEFKEHERPIIATLLRLFDGVEKACEKWMREDERGAVSLIKELSGILKSVLLFVAYFPELLKDPRFIGKIPHRIENILADLKLILNWLENDRSYGQLRDIIRRRYEEEVNRIFSGRLMLDAHKVIRVLDDLEASLSSVEEMEFDVALQLVHSLLFHQKAIQYTLSIVKKYLIDVKSKKLLRLKEDLEKTLKFWRTFRENPDILPNYLEDLVKEIHAYIDEEEIRRMGIRTIYEWLSMTPILSVSILDVKYPEPLLAIGNCILANEKPGAEYEAEAFIVVNNKYRIRRKFWIGKDYENRITIREKFVEKNVESEYVITTYSIFRKIGYIEFLDSKVGEAYAKIEKINDDLEAIKETSALIDKALECLMNFEAEKFHEVLSKERLASSIRKLLDKDFDKFVA